MVFSRGCSCHDGGNKLLGISHNNIYPEAIMKSLKNKRDKELFSIMQWGISALSYPYYHIENKNYQESVDCGILEAMQKVLVELRMRFDT